MTSEISSPYAVLVVEDDPLLRMHAVDIVEDAGFTAIEAKDADEAIAILEKRSDITLLFTDIQMPGSMDGLKLAHAVRDGGLRSRSLSYPDKRHSRRMTYRRTVVFSASRSTVSR
jgi:CheY-like chemotaxis protein